MANAVVDREHLLMQVIKFALIVIQNILLTV